MSRDNRNYKHGVTAIVIDLSRSRDNMSNRVLILVFALGAGCGQVLDNNLDAAGGPGDPGDPTATCSDGFKNATETDIDCGGTCGPCGDTKSCAVGDDCTSKACAGHVCQAPSCVDGIKNANESDVDCGGHCGAGLCKLNQACFAGLDCESRGCEAGRCVATKLVFVTSTRFTASQIGGLNGAAAKCQSAARAAGVSNMSNMGTFKAWLSDSTGSPSTLFARSARPYVRVDGVVVANGYDDLVDGQLLAPISKTELNGDGVGATSGCAVPGLVFTNTRENGTRDDTDSAPASCSNWSAPAGGTTLGSLNSTTSWATGCFDGQSCANALSPLYCFEQ